MAVRLVVSDIFKDDEEGFDSSEPFLFILPAAGRRALLSMAELLTWDSTWVEIAEWGGQGRTPLTDRQKAIVDATIDGLMEFEQVNEITAKLEEIRQAIEGQTPEQLGDNIDALTGVLALLDPRLAVLIQILDGIEDVLGGVEEPPA